MSLRTVFLGSLPQPPGGVGMWRAFSVYQKRRSRLFINYLYGLTTHVLTTEHSAEILQNLQHLSVSKDGIWSLSFLSDRSFYSLRQHAQVHPLQKCSSSQARLGNKTLFHNYFRLFHTAILHFLVPPQQMIFLYLQNDKDINLGSFDIYLMGFDISFRLQALQSPDTVSSSLFCRFTVIILRDSLHEVG